MIETMLFVHNLLVLYCVVYYCKHKCNKDAYFNRKSSAYQEHT